MVTPVQSKWQFHKEMVVVGASVLRTHLKHDTRMERALLVMGVCKSVVIYIPCDSDFSPLCVHILQCGMVLSPSCKVMFCVKNSIGLFLTSNNSLVLSLSDCVNQQKSE